MNKDGIFIERLSSSDLNTLLGDLIDRKLDALKEGKKEDGTSTRYLTRKEAAAMLRISLPTLADWTRQGRIRPCNRIGKRILYSLAEIKSALEGKKGGHRNG